VPPDPDILVDLTSASTEFEAEAIVSELASHGIQAKVFAVADATLRPFTQQAIRVAVRRADLERSLAAIQDFVAKPVVGDWAAVDTGDTSPLTGAELAAVSRTCAACGEAFAAPGALRCPKCGTVLPEGAATADEAASKWTLRILAAVGIILVGGVLFMIVRGLIVR
jgi:hypothetical protein